MIKFQVSCIWLELLFYSHNNKKKLIKKHLIQLQSLNSWTTQNFSKKRENLLIKCFPNTLTSTNFYKLIQTQSIQNSITSL